MRKVQALLRWSTSHPLRAALLVGLALRLIGLSSRSVQYDDVFSIFLAARSLPEIVAGTAADTMPPLFYFILHFWMVLGQQIWLVRLLSVGFSLAVIVLLFQVSEYWLGTPAAGWAALLAAISPLQLYHAQDVRMYMLLVLAQMGYIWCFTRIWFAYYPQGAAIPLSLEAGRTSWRDWLGLVIFGAAAMYTHNLAVFGLLAADIFVLLRARWKLLARLVAAQLVIGLLALPWLLLLPGQLAKIQHAFWTPRPGLVEIIQAVIMFTAAMPLPQTLLVIAAVLSFQVLIMLALELRHPGARSMGVGFMALVLLAPPVLLFAVSYLMRPVFVPRGFLVASLAYDALAGFVISRAWSRPPGKLIAAGFILAAALTLPVFYTFDGFPRSPYQAAAGYLLKASPPGAVVIHDSKLSFFPMRYYAPQLDERFIADPPGTANDTFAPASQQAMQLFPQPDLTTAAAGLNDLFFVTYTRVFDEYRSLGQATHPAIQWLDSHYTRAGHQVFGDLEVFQYRR